MRPIISTKVLLLLLAFLLLVTPTSAQIVSQGFEVFGGGWTAVQDAPSSATLTAQSPYPRTGTYCGCLYTTANSATTPKIYQDIDFTSSHYLVFYVKSSTPEPTNTLKVKIDNTQIILVPTNSGINYVQYSYDVSGYTGYHRLTFETTAGSTNSYWFIDDTYLSYDTYENLIADEGFESGAFGTWHNNGTVNAVINGQAHSGMYGCYCAGGATGSTYQIYQDITVPATILDSVLSLATVCGQSNSYTFTITNTATGAVWYTATQSVASTWTTQNIHLDNIPAGTYRISVSYPRQANGFIIDDFYWFSALSTGGTSAPSSPVASFTANPVIGGSPLTVQFTDTSTGSPTSWHWYFPELGLGSIAQNPIITFPSAGLYSASLNAINGIGSDYENKTNYINVTDGLPIWYSIDTDAYANNGVQIWWNYQSWLTNNTPANYLYIDSYIWENTTLGNIRHSSDMLVSGVLNTYGSVDAVYETANNSNSSLYVRFFGNGAYTDRYVGSALYTHEANSAVLPDPGIIPPPYVPPPYIPPVDPDPYTPPNNTTPPYVPPPTPAPPGNNTPPVIPGGNNTTTGGTYPWENISTVDFSGTGTYYSWVDSVTAPLNNSVMGITQFLLSPITGLTTGLNNVNSNFVSISGQGSYSNSFIIDTIVPISNAIPLKIIVTMAYTMLLSIMSFLLRYR